MLVGIRTLLNSEELTRKYLEGEMRVIRYGYQLWCKYCTYKLVYSSRTNGEESDPERSGDDLRTHVVCLFPKNRSELTGN